MKSDVTLNAQSGSWTQHSCLEGKCNTDLLTEHLNTSSRGFSKKLVRAHHESNMDSSVCSRIYCHCNMGPKGDDLCFKMYWDYWESNPDHFQAKKIKRWTWQNCYKTANIQTFLFGVLRIYLSSIISLCYHYNIAPKRTTCPFKKVNVYLASEENRTLVTSLQQD